MQKGQDKFKKFEDKPGQKRFFKKRYTRIAKTAKNEMSMIEEESDVVATYRWLLI